jgi:hypothetical protein
VDPVLSPAELGVALASAHFAYMSANPRHPRVIGTLKANSLLRWRGLKGDPALDTQMQAYALQHRWTG